MHVLHKKFFSQILFFNKVFNSVTPTRCPANQLISDTNYPELDKPHSSRVQSHKASGAGCKSQDSCHLYFWPTGYKSGVPITSSIRFDHLYNDSQNSRTVHYYYQFILKDAIQEQPNERDEYRCFPENKT